ncbi:MAG: holo-ACP synthase [Deltaproteobacteria bacterium]|nr:holo-ACP synthase [Deltaproteobacteria bacterium]
MIYGVGTDIVQIPRIERIVDRWGNRFIQRVFTPDEIAYCRSKARPAARFALRFAAKEAFVKALGTGLKNGVTLRQIEVRKDAMGRPLLKLHATSKLICAELGISRSFVSLSDDGDYALATVVLEKSEIPLSNRSGDSAVMKS